MTLLYKQEISCHGWAPLIFRTLLKSSWATSPSLSLSLRHCQSAMTPQMAWPNSCSSQRRMQLASPSSCTHCRSCLSPNSSQFSPAAAGMEPCNASEHNGMRCSCAMSSTGAGLFFGMVARKRQVARSVCKLQFELRTTNH